MPQAAAAPVAEVALAESFAVAAPEMFAASVIPEAAMGAEFGTAAAFDAFGSGALGLEGLGMAGLEGISAAAPSLGEAATSGILSGGGGAGAAYINPAMVASQQASAVQAANSGIQQAANYGFSPAELEAMQQGQAMAQNAPIIEQTAGYGLNTPMTSGVQNVGSGYDIASRGVPNAIPEALNVPNPAFSFPSQSSYGTLNAGGGEGLKTAMTELPKAAPSGLQAGFQKALDFAKQNPLSTASMGYSAMKLLGSGSGSSEPEKEEYDGILTKYKMSPNFKGRHANPEDFQYTPKVYTNAAEGGIMQAYTRGGKTDSDPTGGSKIAMDYYESMSRKLDLPSMKSDVGIIYDTDPETRSLDPVTAAQIRQAKVNKRANMQLPSMKRPTPMGQINLAPPSMKEQDGDVTEAAQGGIMQVKRYQYGGPVDEEVGGFGRLAQPAAPAQTATSTASQAPQATQNSGKSWAQTAQSIGDSFDSAIRTFLSTPPLVVSFLDGALQALGAGPYSGQASMAPGPAVGSQAPGFMQANEGAKQNIANVSYDGDSGSSRFSGPSGGGGGGRGNVSIGNGATASGVGTGIGSLGNMGGGLAAGGLSSLGGYAAGGNPRLLKGPGDGMSDNIPATIAGKQPARLADGEFVIPADVVSHLGNGSTEAGAKVLHGMMNKVRKARTGNSKQGKQINPRKFLPA